jgi:hypothetical protein
VKYGVAATVDFVLFLSLIILNERMMLMKNKEVTIDFSKANELTQIAYAKVLGVVGPYDSLSPNILSSFCYSSDDIDVKIFQLLKENKFPMDHVGTVFYKEFIRKIINRIREGNLSNTMSLEELIKLYGKIILILSDEDDDGYMEYLNKQRNLFCMHEIITQLEKENPLQDISLRNSIKEKMEDLI